MQCPRCRCEVQEDMQYCPKCGLKFEKCPHCHAPLMTDAKFCTICGKQVQYNEEENGYYTPINDQFEDNHTTFKDIPTKKKVNKKIVIISVVVLIALSLISVIYLNQTTNQQQKHPNQSNDLSKKQSIHIAGETSHSSLSANRNQNGYAAFSDGKLYVNNGHQLIVMDDDLSKQKTLVNTNASYIQVVGDKVYYVDEQYHLCSIQTDGSDQKTIINQAIYYVTVENDKVYYQLDEDNESLYMYDLTHQKSTKINNRPSYELNVVDNQIYYSSDDGVYKIGVDGKGEEKLINGAVYNLVYQDQKLYYTSQQNATTKCYDINTKKESVLIQGKSQLLNMTDQYLFYLNSELQVKKYNLQTQKEEGTVYSGNVESVFVVGDHLIMNSISNIESKNNYKIISDFSGDHQQRLFLEEAGDFI